MSFFKTSRRALLKRSALLPAASVSAPYFVPRQVLGFGGVPGANEQVVVGVVGVGVRGKQLIRKIQHLAHKGRVAAICACDARKIAINRNKFTTNPPDFVRNPPDPKLAEKWEGDGWVAQGHIENWFDCIKSRAKPTADVEIGHRTVTVGHLINIAREVGRKLRWDPVQERIFDDPEANALRDRPRRKGWELPDLG